MEWIGYIAAVAASIWVYRDAKSRYSSHPGLWAFGVLMVLIVFLPLYLWFRPKKPCTAISKHCPHCAKPYEGTPNFCPTCGQTLKSEE
jgi:endogenous inhibitor of DNA gyrase (YacG/DUF329 family)